MLEITQEQFNRMRDSGAFSEVRLYVKDAPMPTGSEGAEAKTHYVTTVMMPKFIQAPNVIIWGERVFHFDTEVDAYVEAFSVWAVNHIFNPVMDDQEGG